MQQDELTNAPPDGSRDGANGGGLKNRTEATSAAATANYTTNPERIEVTNGCNTDRREQTFNQGHCGPIGLISTAVDAVGQIRTVMLDIDLKLFNPDGPFSPEGLTPLEFYARYVAVWLDNHPVLRKAEVRFTGGGFHVLLNLLEPIRLDTDDRRKRWKGIVQVVQMALPTDPQQPGINAMTRPVGSVNSKNGEIVTLFREGEPVTEPEIVSMFDEMRRQPFLTLMKIWFGTDKLSPCPICREEGSYLESEEAKKGRCYGPCGQVTIGKLYTAVLVGKTKTTKKKGKNE